MENVTTAIVGFIFVCIVLPHIIKNKHFYYLAVAAVLVSMLFKALAVMIGSMGFIRIATFFIMLLEMGAIILLILAAGGLTIGEFASNMTGAIDAMRGNQNGPTPIVPIGGQAPAGPTQPTGRSGEESGRATYIIDDHARTAPKSNAGGSLPLE